MSEKRLPHLRLVQPGGDKEPRPRRRARACFAGFVGTILLIVSFFAVLGLLRPRNPLPPPLGEIAVATPMAGAIIQNTPGQSEGYPLGVPEGYAWCSGSYKPADNSAPPTDFTSVTGKGLIYPEIGSPDYPGQGVITIANAKTYVHLRATREWVLVQDQATDGITGAHFASDFSAKPGRQMKLDAQPDRSVAIGAPPIGYNDSSGQPREGRMRLQLSMVCTCRWKCGRMIRRCNSLQALEPTGGATRAQDLCRVQLTFQAPA